mgnify:CR=1 FL=1
MSLIMSPTKKTDKKQAKPKRFEKLSHEEHHDTLITKAKDLLDFASSGKVTITQGIDGVTVKVEATTQ